MDIYKITSDPLTLVEQDFKVQKMEPILGSKLTAEFYFESIIHRYNKNGKILSPAELGCSLSHLSIYQNILKKDKPAIILESDILTSKKQLETAIRLCSNRCVDFVHLGLHPFYRRGVYFRGKFKKDLGLYIVDPYNDFNGTFAYYITPKCAKKLIEFHKKTIMPADFWSVFFQKNNLNPYFFPVFEHPEERGDIHSQRSIVSTKVFSLTFENARFYFKKIFLRKMKIFRFNKKIKPRDINGNTI